MVPSRRQSPMDWEPSNPQPGSCDLRGSFKPLELDILELHQHRRSGMQLEC
jgi:hypothetical protein